MLFETILLLYATAVGFVAAGIAGSLYQLITQEPPRFPGLSGGFVAIVLSWLVCAVTGPFIVGRMLVAAWRQRNPREKTTVGWSMAGIAVAGLWSGCSGIVLIQFGVAFLRNVA